MTVPRPRRLFLGALPAVLAALAPRQAAAHAILMESEPQARGRIAAGPIAFRLRFNSRIDAGRSRLTLTLPDRSQRVLALGPVPSDDHLAADETLAPGAHTLRWQVLAVDGHITRGDVPFTVLPAGRG